MFDGPFPEARAALLRDPVPTIEAGHTFSGMEYDYATHPWGLHHATQPYRYTQRHGYNPDQMLPDLGNDIHPVRHLRVTHDHVVALGITTLGRRNAINLSDPREIAVARATSLWHDTGETTHPDLDELCGYTIGDILSGTKTPEDRLQEYKLLGTVLSTVGGSLPEHFRQRILNVSTHKEDSVAHRLFDVAHEWGFYAVALRAGRLALSLRDEEPTPSHRTAQLGRLARSVTVGVRPNLEKAIPDFPVIDERLERAARTHEKINAVLGV
jgi:hypothetical protein